MVLFNKVTHSSGQVVLCGSINGNQFTVPYTERLEAEMAKKHKEMEDVINVEEYNALVEEFTLLTQLDYQTLLNKLTPYLVHDTVKGTYHLYHKGKVISTPLPNKLKEILEDLISKNMDITPILKCYIRFMRGPAELRSSEKVENFLWYITQFYTDPEKVQSLIEEGYTEEAATTLATSPQVAITSEGLIVGYKVSLEVDTKFAKGKDGEVIEVPRYDSVVDEDTGEVTTESPEFVEERLFEPYVMGDRGDAFYCGDKLGHRIKVGEIIMLDSWDKVGAPGHKGLHCGGLNYIKGYQGSHNSVTHNIFVDPQDIHSVTTSCDGALTCRRYYVYSSFVGVNRSRYVPSTLSAITDAEYDKMVADTIAADAENIASKESELYALAKLTKEF